jgi:hypothetical protein
MTQATAHEALAFDCPFCKVPAGQPCRTRNSGREQTWPHSRRIVRTTPPEERHVPTRVGALCCVCGKSRTVSSDYRRSRDPNDDYSDDGKKEGWRRTNTLKCDACGGRTRHAILSGDVDYRDSDERYQRYTLGGEWEGNPQYAPDRDRLREEYFAQFPRNPKLHHWVNMAAAEEARERGETHMPALCGDTTTVPREWSKRSKKAGPVAPNRIDWDTEFEDPETGKWWVDMDCVNCLRVTNEQRAAREREQLEWLLMYVAARPELIPDADVTDILQTLEHWYDKSKEPTDPS